MPRTITIEMLRRLVKPRPEEGHKGTFGHGLLIAGSYGMAGAGVLAGRACMRSGVGKLTVHIPRSNNDIMQVALPEAILHHDTSEVCWTSMPFSASGQIAYNAIGMGPGIGTGEETAEALHQLLVALKDSGLPMVVDADALNILARYPKWFELLPEGTIITPHPLEYGRLRNAGVDMKNMTLVLKGHPTTITLPGDGQPSWVCPWGNSGMGTAGGGDVLTGVILGLLTQGYTYEEAAVLGVSLHALAGDEAAGSMGGHSLIASDLVEHLHRAFWKVKTMSGDIPLPLWEPLGSSVALGSAPLMRSK